MDLILGECRRKLFAEQRQKIAIACILILDEVTSTLDNETETIVMESLDALQGIKTLIIVVHRLTTINNCDRVYEKYKDGIAVGKE